MSRMPNPVLCRFPIFAVVLFFCLAGSSFGTPAEELLCDFNGDFKVDSSDLGLWESEFGTSATGLLNDDGDGDADGADFLCWQRELDEFGAGQAHSTTVPEPSSLLMAGYIAMSLALFLALSVLFPRQFR